MVTNAATHSIPSLVNSRTQSPACIRRRLSLSKTLGRRRVVGFDKDSNPVDLDPMALWGSSMPSKEEVGKIQVAFARQYDLDLLGIHSDSAALKTSLLAPSNNGAATFYTYNGNEAVVPDLETTDASQIVPDQRLSIRQIEANLDEAGKYSQACLQLRAQYGEIAKNRNDTRFKGEEFLRLDAVHLQEIDAGLYKLPWQEAADEAAGLEAAVAQANVQQGIPQEMTGDIPGTQQYAAILSAQGMTDQIKGNAFITKNVANTMKDDVSKTALSTAAYRTHMELATWLNTLAGARSSAAQLNSRLLIAKRKEDYLRKDEGFKLQRAYISEQLAWLQIAEHCRSGSVLNYDERLKATKALFDENLRSLVERTLVIGQGLKGVYGINLPIGDLPTGGILDQISPWIVKATDALSKWKRTQRLTTVQIVGTKLLAASDGKTFETTFTVEDSALPSENSLLRGANFEFTGDNRLPISAAVTPPAGVTLGGSVAPLRFGRVCSVAPSLELKPLHSDLLWNGSPKGLWKLTGTLPSKLSSTDEMIMYLWVVST